MTHEHDSTSDFNISDLPIPDPADPNVQDRLDKVLGVERPKPLTGIKMAFLHPEVLRAYITDPERPRGITPEQRMARVTGREIAGFDISKGIFSTVSVR